VSIVHAIARLLALHFALGLRALFWLCALPFALRLFADVVTWLLVLLATFHGAHRFLAAFRLALCTLLAWARQELRAHHNALGLSTLHLATFSIEALAAS